MPVVIAVATVAEPWAVRMPRPISYASAITGRPAASTLPTPIADGTAPDVGSCRLGGYSWGGWVRTGWVVPVLGWLRNPPLIVWICATADWRPAFVVLWRCCARGRRNCWTRLTPLPRW